MNAAIVHDLKSAPRFAEYRNPVAEPGQSMVLVSASALSHLAKNRASGSHYSSGADLNFVPGVDGVGRLVDGRKVYFMFPEAPFGAMGETTLVDDNRFIVLPEEVDDVTMAALAIPAMSSWAALTQRAQIRSGDTVLINGATGTSGRLAVQIAKHLGAGKVIATGREGAALRSLTELGADLLVSLQQPEEGLMNTLRAEMQGVHIVLDYLWGRSAEQIIAAKCAQDNPVIGERCRFVQIGSMGGSDITLSAAALRSSGLELVGSGHGSVSVKDMLTSIRAVAEAQSAAGFEVRTEAVPLSQVEATWNASTEDRRLVYRI